MSRRKSPPVSIENNDDGLKTLNEVANGTIMDPKGIDTVIHNLAKHEYSMPHGHDYEEISTPCRKYAPDIADQFDMAYHSLFESKLLLEAAMRENESGKQKAKLSLDYVKSHRAFYKIGIIAQGLIRDGIERKAKERKSKEQEQRDADAMDYV